MIEELLNKYDLFHSSILNGGKIKFNINYLPDGNVYISLVALINGEDRKYTVDIIDNDDFKFIALPKILESYFSKNPTVEIRKIMGNNNQGTLVIQGENLKDSLIIRNCTTKTMRLAESLYETLLKMNKQDDDSTEGSEFNTYLKYNIIFDYAKYRSVLFNETGEIDEERLFLLNIARYAFSIENNEQAFDEVKKIFDENERVIKVCDLYKENDYSDNNIYSKIILLAEFEKDNDRIIHNSGLIIQEAAKAVKEDIKFFNNNYLNYWNSNLKVYNDDKLKNICLGFINSYRIQSRESNAPKRKNNHDKLLISTIKDIKSRKSILPQEIPYDDNPEIEEIKKAAEEQAMKIFELEKEREELIQAADEYAKIILKNAKEAEQMQNEKEEQAKRIKELEDEKLELRRMADEFANQIIEREKILDDEAEIRKEIITTPVKSQDVDKINNLLYAISAVKNLDYAINHPTISQELSILEEKTITYLTTHTNIIHEEDRMLPVEKEEMIENKPVIELLSMLRNAYNSSHMFEKDGRHSLISLNPVDEDTYRISIYSVKEDDEDLLMDVFFEHYQLTDNVLEEICNIYKDGAIVVASKTDNVPPDKADFLAIDSMNNAIRFMDCKREIIDKVKEYV